MNRREFLAAGVGAAAAVSIPEVLQASSSKVPILKPLNLSGPRNPSTTWEKPKPFMHMSLNYLLHFGLAERMPGVGRWQDAVTYDWKRVGKLGGNLETLPGYTDGAYCQFCNTSPQNKNRCFVNVFRVPFLLRLQQDMCFMEAIDFVAEGHKVITGSLPIMTCVNDFHAVSMIVPSAKGIWCLSDGRLTIADEVDGVLGMREVI